MRLTNRCVGCVAAARGCLDRQSTGEGSRSEYLGSVVSCQAFPRGCSDMSANACARSRLCGTHMRLHGKGVPACTAVVPDRNTSARIEPAVGKDP
eukprot:571609-Prorocentrum_minimum.AAC.3